MICDGFFGAPRGGRGQCCGAFGGCSGRLGAANDPEGGLMPLERGRHSRRLAYPTASKSS